MMPHGTLPFTLNPLPLLRSNPRPCREATRIKFSISLKNKKKGGVISGIRRIYLIFVWNKIEQKLNLAEIRK
jgi:hypothetical protein